MKNFKKLCPVLMVLLSCIYFLLLTLWLPKEIPLPFPHSKGALITVSVVPGMTARDVAFDFMESGLVKDPEMLLKMMLHTGVHKKIKVGTYTLHAGSPWEVANELAHEAPKPFRWTIVPGYTFAQIANRAGGADAPERLEKSLLNDALYPAGLRDLLPENYMDRIAFLLPDTYSVPPGTEHLDLLVRVSSALWWEKIGKKAAFVADGKAKMLNLATLASLVEKEVKYDDERPIAAGIFLNRLKIKMPLQSCASVVFAWGLLGEKKTSLTFADLEINSPYNTYKNYGLPPGPVGVPSLVSWESAIKPAKTDFLYFVLGKNGRHIFSRTFKEHVLAIKSGK